MKKETYVQLTTEFLEDFEARIRKEEREKIKNSIIDEDEYIGLDYALSFMSRLMLLNKNGIKKYLFEKNVLDMKDGKYIPKNNSKYVNDILCVKKESLILVMSLNIYVSDYENNNTNNILKAFARNKDGLCMLSYEMHNADEQKNNKKFDRIKTVINKLSSNGDDLND